MIFHLKFYWYKIGLFFHRFRLVQTDFCGFLGQAKLFSIPMSQTMSERLGFSQNPEKTQNWSCWSAGVCNKKKDLLIITLFPVIKSRFCFGCFCEHVAKAIENVYVFRVCVYIDFYIAHTYT